MLPLPLLALLGGGAALGAARGLLARRYERLVARKLPVTAAGIIAGAEPFELPARGDAPGLLLLHGFGDTPQTLRYVAAALHADGYGVRVPLLPGHGRTLRDFARSGADAWIAHARAELAQLRARHRDVAVVGLSMGGALATILAAEEPDVRACVLLAPYLSMPNRIRRIARVHRLLALVAPYAPGRGERSIHDPAEQARSLAYGYVTPRLLRELLTVVERSQRALPRLATPVIVFQSREDNRIPVEACEREFAKITAPERRLEWLSGCGHLISVDFGHERISASVREFLARHLPVTREAEMARRA